jgi:hypothetical protein
MGVTRNRSNEGQILIDLKKLLVSVLKKEMCIHLSSSPFIFILIRLYLYLVVSLSVFIPLK